MQKTDLIKLIQKYHLDGTCDKVKWEVKDKELRINFTSEDKSMKGSLVTNIDLEDGEFGIGEAGKLIAFLGALDGDLKIDYYFEKNKITGIQFEDSQVKAKYNVSELDKNITPEIQVFRPESEHPLLQKDPEWGIEIVPTKESLSKFIKCKGAMKDEKSVTFIRTDDNLDFVIGYSSEYNSSKITIPFKAKFNLDPEITAYSADSLTSIFGNNTDFREAKINFMQSLTTMMVEFKNEDCEVKYYLKAVHL